MYNFTTYVLRADLGSEIDFDYETSKVALVKTNFVDHLHHKVQGLEEEKNLKQEIIDKLNNKIDIMNSEKLKIRGEIEHNESLMNDLKYTKFIFLQQSVPKRLSYEGETFFFCGCFYSVIVKN